MILLISQWKTGYKTTEFWASLAVVAIPFINAFLPESSQLDAESIIAAGVAAAGYAASRGYLKGKRNEALAYGGPIVESSVTAPVDSTDVEIDGLPSDPHEGGV